MDTLGTFEKGYSDEVNKSYELIVKSLCREYGVFQLSERSIGGHREPIEELVSFFLQEKDIEKSLDAIELSFRVIDTLTRRYEYLYRSDASELADEAVADLNSRFREHGVGYQYDSGQVIRVDSELIHSEVVKPALRLLGQKHYAGAQQEFLKAHDHYQKGNSKEALNCCLNAFESAMKAICDKRGWGYDKNETSKSLIQRCFDNELVPSFWQQQYSSLRSLLESSVPTGRNKLSGHGQGTKPVPVPNHLVAYMLHMTASAILFLAEAEKNLS